VGVEGDAVEITGWIAERYDLTHRLGNWAARGLMPALEGVTAEIANWRPAPDQHTIGEIVAHLAYHTDLVAKRLRGGSWEFKREDDWQAGPSTEAGWTQVRSKLERAHEDFSAALAGLRADQLLEPLDKSWLSLELVTRRIDYAIDVATHDLYHAGQIFVLKRLFGRGQPESRSAA
jgi:uncharacterized damage-inducible protein DinB